MSADNWRVCPKCVIERKRQEIILDETLKAFYGKITPEEYVVRVNQVNRAKASRQEETLREDYEIGTKADGVFFVSYGCSCEVCGFSFTFQQTKGAL